MTSAITYIYIHMCVCVRVGERMPPPCLCVRSSSTCVHAGLYRSMRLSACIAVAVFFLSAPFERVGVGVRGIALQVQAAFSSYATTTSNQGTNKHVRRRGRREEVCFPREGAKKSNEAPTKIPTESESESERAKQTATRVCVAHVRSKTAGKRKRNSKKNAHRK